MKEQALIGARGLVSPSLCIPVLQSVSCYRGAAVMPFSRRLWRVLGEVGLADEVRGMEAGLRTVVGPAGTRLSGGAGSAVNSSQGDSAAAEGPYS